MVVVVARAVVTRSRTTLAWPVRYEFARCDMPPGDAFLEQLVLSDDSGLLIGYIREVQLEVGGRRCGIGESTEECRIHPSPERDNLATAITRASSNGDEATQDQVDSRHTSEVPCREPQRKANGGRGC